MTKQDDNWLYNYDLRDKIVNSHRKNETKSENQRLREEKSMLDYQIGEIWWKEHFNPYLFWLPMFLIVLAVIILSWAQTIALILISIGMVGQLVILIVSLTAYLPMARKAWQEYLQNRHNR